MNNTLLRVLTPEKVLMAAVFISAASLLSAFAAEAFLSLEPCRLCIYQRWPFVFVVVLAGSALTIGKKCSKAPFVGLLGSAFAFLINSGIALYHSGVERHWWKSAVDGCLVPNLGAEPQSILKNIMSAPTGRCDQIPWADPLLGLSMANYNVALSFGFFVICTAALLFSFKASHQEAKRS